MKKVKFGIIGAGNIGAAHYEVFMKNQVPNGELVAIADLVPAKLEAVRKKGQELNPEAEAKVTYFNSGDELIASGICDAVTVAVPSDVIVTDCVVSYRCSPSFEAIIDPFGMNVPLSPVSVMDISVFDP